LVAARPGVGTFVTATLADDTTFRTAGEEDIA
jgi:hypothetical protein